jgi:hypothetical protein
MKTSFYFLSKPALAKALLSATAMAAVLFTASGCAS